MQRCGYPDCRALSAGTFALVPLCQGHLDTIQQETRKWYAGQRIMNYEEQRAEYLHIADQVPWSRPMLDLKHGRTDDNGEIETCKQA